MYAMSVGMHGIDVRCSCETIPYGLVEHCYRCGRRDRMNGRKERVPGSRVLTSWGFAKGSA